LWEVYVVKADADTLTKQQGSTCCASPAATADNKAGEPVAAGGCC
ncbi:glyoxalase/bleomycin resistance/dioxygenase family protein, partial [Streptomyces sp. NPDC057674]